MTGPDFIQPKTPAEQLATEIDDILHEWFPSAGAAQATADILDAVARYEAANTARVLGTSPVADRPLGPPR